MSSTSLLAQGFTDDVFLRLPLASGSTGMLPQPGTPTTAQDRAALLHDLP